MFSLWMPHGGSRNTSITPLTLCDQLPILAALPQSLSGSFGGKKNLLALLEINPQLLGHLACSLVTVLT